jgi:NMT1/THI5 like.
LIARGALSIIALFYPPGGTFDACADLRDRRCHAVDRDRHTAACPVGRGDHSGRPGVQLDLRGGYIASDLNLWGNHGIKVKTVAITGIGAINSVISGSSHFAQASASSFGRASARGQKLVAIATTIDRPFAQVVLRKEIAEAGGYDAKSPLGSAARCSRAAPSRWIPSIR